MKRRSFLKGLSSIGAGIAVTPKVTIDLLKKPVSKDWEVVDTVRKSGTSLLSFDSDGFTLETPYWEEDTFVAWVFECPGQSKTWGEDE